MHRLWSAFFLCNFLFLPSCSFEISGPLFPLLGSVSSDMESDSVCHFSPISLHSALSPLPDVSRSASLTSSSPSRSTPTSSSSLSDSESHVLALLERTFTDDQIVAYRNLAAIGLNIAHFPRVDSFLIFFSVYFRIWNRILSRTLLVIRHPTLVLRGAPSAWLHRVFGQMLMFIRPRCMHLSSLLSCQFATLTREHPGFDLSSPRLRAAPSRSFSVSRDCSS